MGNEVNSLNVSLVANEAHLVRLILQPDAKTTKSTGIPKNARAPKLSLNPPTSELTRQLRFVGILLTVRFEQDVAVSEPLSLQFVGHARGSL